jgi:hypothetical protein
MDQLRWRGLVANSTDQQALAEQLAAGPVIVVLPQGLGRDTRA